MIPFDELFKDGQLNKFMEEKSKNLWEGTLFEKYPLISNKNKGALGEKIVGKYMASLNCSVRERKNSGQDFLIDGYKTEVKISLAHETVYNQFALNHISIKKDWERLIFLGVNYDLSKSKMVFFKKQDFIDHMDNTASPLFKHQQGGEKIKNDDYILMGNFDNFFHLNFVYDISEWKNKEELRGLEFWLK